MDDDHPIDWEHAYADGLIESPLDPHVLELAPTLEPGTALDLGCGAGQNSIWLAERGWTVTGVDISPSAIRLAHAAAQDAGVVAKFVVADSGVWTPQGSFDFVFSTYALPSKGPGRTRALETAATAVAPGGTILVTEFDRSLGSGGGWSEDDLIDTNELQSHLAGFEIVQLSVETTRHAHGHHEERYPVAIAIARRGMSELFVPTDFEVPLTFDGPGFRLEPLGPVHNERDHEAWMSSIEHIRATPGMAFRSWPRPMTLEENMADMEMHAGEFAEKQAFTYSILDGDTVIGCVYVYPATDDNDAVVRSWVTQDRSEMDAVVWRSLSRWLETAWPFGSFSYASRD